MHVFDSHVHFWKYDKEKYQWISRDMKILREDHLPEHFALVHKRNEVDGVIAIEADSSELETHFLVELANTHSFIQGVIGWIDLKLPNVEERLRYFAQYPIIKGWRYVLQNEADDIFIDPRFQSGIRALELFGYTFDLLIAPKQLKAAAQLASKFTDQRFVLDHCGKPDVRKGDRNEWEAGMKALAANPNVYCKVSGLFTETKWKDWKPADFYPYFDIVFETFGIDRVMYGSDWPVMLLSGMYVQWKSLLEKYMENYSQVDREKFFNLNVMQFYNIDLTT